MDLKCFLWIQNKHFYTILMYNLGMARGEEKGWHRDRPIDVDVQNRWLMYD